MMNWYKKHLNWTWTIAYTLILMVACSFTIYTAFQDTHSFYIAIAWYWVVYLVGTFSISKWVLRKKNRDLDWLWLTMLVFPITPLLLSNKAGNIVL